MTLPLLPYEWRRFTRSGQVHSSRFWVLLLPLYFAVMYVLDDQRPNEETLANAHGLARAMAIASGVMIALISSGTAAAFTGALFLKDRESGVLDLLLLTKAKGIEVVFTKIIPPLVAVTLLLLAVLPFVVWATLLSASSSLALLAFMPTAVLHAAVVCMVGAVVSTAITRAAGGTQITTLAGFLGLWLWFDVLNVSIAGTPASPPLTVNPTAQSLWLMAGGSVAVAGLSLAVAPVLLARSPYGVSAKVATARQRNASRKHRSRRGIEPVTYLSRTITGYFGFTGRHLVVKLIAFAGLVAACLLPIIGWLLVCMVIFRESTLAWARNREGGVFDDLALVPQTDESLGRNVLAGQIRAGAPYAVALVLALAGLYFANDVFSLPALSVPPLLLAVVASIVLAQYVITITWATWSGTRAAQGVPGMSLGFMMTLGAINGLLFFAFRTGFVGAVFPGPAAGANAPSLPTLALGVILPQVVVWLPALVLVRWSIPRIGRNIRQAEPPGFAGNVTRGWNRLKDPHGIAAL